MSAVFFRTLIYILFLSNLTSNAYAGEITVSAASSLTDAFKEIAFSFEKKYPSIKVLFNFSASGFLLQQLAKGAPVDVIAFADLDSMDLAEAQGLVHAKERKVFAGNTLVVIIPQDSKLTLKNLQDLTKAEVKRLAIGNSDSVPAGRYGKMALQEAGIWQQLTGKFIQTQNVRQALDYVVRGEVDAGIVYATDAGLFKEKIRIALDLTDSRSISIRYPIASTAKSKQVDESRLFVDYVNSEQGLSILSKFGFKKP